MAETVIVVQRNGGGGYVQGARVSLQFSALFSGGFTDSVYTNSDGEAVISHSNSGEAKVYVNGDQKGTMKTPGRKHIYL